jgi:hypothetical protein
MSLPGGDGGSDPPTAARARYRGLPCWAPASTRLVHFLGAVASPCQVRGMTKNDDNQRQTSKDVVAGQSGVRACDQAFGGRLNCPYKAGAGVRVPQRPRTGRGRRCDVDCGLGASRPQRSEGASGALNGPLSVSAMLATHSPAWSARSLTAPTAIALSCFAHCQQKVSLRRVTPMGIPSTGQAGQGRC